MAEVLNAPKRRVDNEVSRLSDSVCVLQMHCKIIEDIGSRYKAAVFRSRVSLFSTFFGTVFLPSAALLGAAISPEFGVASGVASGFVLGYPAVVALGAVAGTNCHQTIPPHDSLNTLHDSEACQECSSFYQLTNI